MGAAAAGARGRQGHDSQPVPSRSGIYRALLRAGMIDAGARRRRDRRWKRWERARPMELWQMDLVGGMGLADGSELKILTGVDDHSRYCVLAAAMRRATGRAVCQAFTQALAHDLRAPFTASLPTGDADGVEVGSGQGHASAPARVRRSRAE